MKKLATLILMALLLCAATAEANSNEVKAAFVYVGPVGDGGWTYSHDLGRRAMETLPFVQKSAYIEAVPEGAEATRVIMALAQKGYNPIFTASFGYMDPTLEAAKHYKNIIFEHCSGYKTSANMGNYNGRIYQAKYLAGIVGGAMTKSNIIGYVAAYPIPELIRDINAFTLGAQSVNPDVEVRVVWTQTWFNPGLERSAADSLLDVGADVLTMAQDTPATLQAAEARGAYAIGYHSDMKQYAPNAFLTAAIWNWGVLYKHIATEIHAGTWQPEEILWGMESDAVTLAPISTKVPQQIRDKVIRKKHDIINQKMKIFTGPIIDQNGREVLARDKTFSDKQLLSMNFFIKGVQGTIPQ